MSEIDVAAITKYNNAIAEGKTHTEAYNTSMTEAGIAAKTMAVNANGTTIELKAMSVGAKIAATGLKLLKMAGGFLLNLVFVEALNYIVTKFSDVSDATNEAKNSVEKYGKSFGEALDEAKEHLDSMNNSQKDYNKSAKELSNNYDSYKKISKEIYELAEAENLTSKNKERLIGYIDKLNKELPNLGLEYDKNTGKLNMTKDMLDSVISKYEDYYKVIAAQDRMVQLNADKIENDAEIELLEKKKKNAEEKLKDANEKFNETKISQYGGDVLTNLFGDDADINADIRKEKKKYENLVKEYNDSLSDLKESQNDIDSQMNITNKVLNESSKNYNEVKEQIEGTKKATENLETTNQTFDLSTYTDQIDQVQDRISKLQSAFEKLSSGDMSDNDLLDFLQEFPELTLYANDVDELKKHIQSLIKTSPNGLIKSLETLKSNLKTDKEVKQVDNLIEVLKKLGVVSSDVSDSAKSFEDIKKDVVELYEKKYDTAIDKLNEEKSALESQKQFLEDKKQAVADIISEYEKAADVVQKYIDKQREEIEDRYNSEIDKIKSVNEEKQESIDLQEKLNALENAKKKKVNMYSESQGWHLETNQTEVDKAQRDYDNAVLDKQISDLEKKRDEELKLWDNYKQQWQDIVDDIKNADDEITASKILGSDWTEKIAQKDTDILNQFGQAYSYYQNDLSKQVDSEIDSIENAIDAKENQIKVYTEEKNALKDYVEDIEESNQTYLDNLNNMALSERSTMEERVAFLEACKERIKRAMDISDTAVSSGQNDVNITDSNGNTSHNFNPDKRYHVKYNGQELGSPSSRREAESIRDTYIRNHAGEFGMAGLLIAGTLNPISSQFADYVARKLKEARKQFSIRQYLNGGVIDYTGIAKVDGTKSSPEVVFSNSQAKKLYDIVSQSGDLSAKISQNISGSLFRSFADTIKNLVPGNNIKNKTISSPTNITIHIDKVETPDGQNFVRQMEGYLKQTELDRMVGKKR